MANNSMSGKIESDAPMIDAHGHTLDLAFKSKGRFHHALGGLTDVALMRAGGVTAQLTACWAPDAAAGPQRRGDRQDPGWQFHACLQGRGRRKELAVARSLA